MKKGWELKKLEKVADIISGQSPQSKYYNINGDGLPFYQGKKEFTEEFIAEPTKWTSKVTKVALKDDILMSVRAPVGPVNFAINKCCIGRGLASIRPNNNLLNKYLFLYLISFKKNLTGNTGAVFNSINRKEIGEIKIPLPSLNEQKAIVTKLDQAFKAIDQAKANLEQNLANAEDLFQSKLNQIFSQTGEGWEKKKLGEVCEQIFAGGDKPKENFSKEKCEAFKIPIFANAVKSKGLYGYTDKARVMKPALTIAGRGSGTGHTELRREPFLPIVRLIVCIPDERITTIEFLKYSIDNLILIKSGSAIPQLTVPMIKTYKINLPSLAKQNSIIDKLDLLQNKSFDLKSKYQQKLESLEELKQSILEKAFKGELV